VASIVLSGREIALSPKVKDYLVKHILYEEECVFVLTISDMRRLAFQIAEEISNYVRRAPFRQGLRGPKPWLGPLGPGSDLQNSYKTRKTLKMT
jgi:hypothetical protein